MLRLRGAYHYHFTAMAVEQGHLQVAVQGSAPTVASRSQVTSSGHDSKKRCQSVIEELEHCPESMTSLGVPGSHSHNKQEQNGLSAEGLASGERSPLG